MGKHLRFNKGLTVSVQTLHTIAFRIVYSSFFLFSLLGHINVIEAPFRYFRYATMPILVAVVLYGMKSCSKKGVFVAFFILILGFFSGDANLIKIIILSFAAKGEELRSCVRFEMKLRFIVITGVIALYHLGIAPDICAWSNGEIRHSMGFTNPNTFGIAVAILCLEMLYLSDMKIDLIKGVVILILCKYVDWCSKSRTAVLVILLSLFLAIVNTVFPKALKKSWMKSIIMVLPSLCGGMTIIMIVLFSLGSSLAKSINKLFSERLAFPLVYLKEWPITLLGMNRNSIGLTIDNAYIYTWIAWGVVGFIFFIVAQTLVLRKSAENNDTALQLVFVCFTIYGLAERLWMNIDYNIFVLAYVAVAFNNQNSRNHTG